MTAPRIRRFVALGDSFTEGLDDLRPDGTPRGWADLTADVLATSEPDFHYANLAVRSRRVDAVVDEQVPAAIAMEADLVTLAAGANDLLGLRADANHVGRRIDEALTRLRATGATTIVFAGFDPRNHIPTGRLLTMRTQVYNAHVRVAARRHGCLLVDLWAMQELRDSRLWSADRLHLSTLGHHHIAAVVLAALGRPEPDGWRVPVDPLQRKRWLIARAHDVRWSQRHLAPWVMRKLRGRSMGDGREPKYPTLVPWTPAE